jgi:hypothetical protein
MAAQVSLSGGQLEIELIELTSVQYIRLVGFVSSGWVGVLK